MLPPSVRLWRQATNTEPMGTQRIWILPDFLASQIAAGEVIQRPESVVKELVENSLDAGATQIAVNVRGAGKQLVHVVDNGCGMSREDLALCIRRHATSKLRSAEDLHRITTLGFRGEALAAIAAVAHLEIRTRTAEEHTGWRLLSEPDAQPRIEPWAMEPGTQVFVRNLFFNVPARRKFLRSDLSEFRLVSDLMVRFALAAPHVRLTFSDERTLIFDLPAGTLLERLERLFGEEFARALIPVEAAEEGVVLSGFIGHPQQARPSRAQQFLFLNGRWIQHKGIAHAVFTAYEQLLEPGTFPPFVLYLQLDPERVDVNVHPQKHEVKFEDERFIYGVVHTAVARALQSHNVAPTLGWELAQAPLERQPDPQSGQVLVNRLTGEIVLPERFHRRAAPVGVRPVVLPAPSVPSPAPAQQPELAELPPSPRCWQLHRRYILWETPQGVRIVDQHVAHERVLYERILRLFERGEPLPQRLLLPLTVQLDPAAFATLEELRSELERLGFELRLLPPNQVELQAVPAELPPGREEQLLCELLESYREYEQHVPGGVRERVAAALACRMAVKSGEELSELQIRTLLQQLLECRLPYVCPHGRPVFVELPLEELDRRFERR
jgi:DNA mismatch repair protein MutL